MEYKCFKYRWTNQRKIAENEDLENGNQSVNKSNSKRKRIIRTRKIIKIIFIVLCVLCPVVFIIIFVILPVVFMNSLYLQQILVFTHFDLPNNKTFFKNIYGPGVKNHYVEVKDLDGTTNVSLGVWHLLPVELTYKSYKDEDFDFDAILKSSNFSVILSFHGTGECRADSLMKYEVLRHYFHIIAFDYRSYADSSKASLSEEAVVNDCVQLYLWLLEKTNSPIYIWGHSLGTALATRTLSLLQKQNILAKGLILESAFTSFSDEIRVHPYGKIFAWLPWFKATILDPLEKNGFVFNTAKNILNVSCPILMLHAEDDDIVPIELGRKLYEIAVNRRNIPINDVKLYIAPEKLQLKHNLIYRDPFLQYFLRDFLQDCNDTNYIFNDSFP